MQGFQNPVWELSRAPTISDMVYLLKHVSTMFRGDVSVDMTMMRHSAWLKKRPRNSMELPYLSIMVYDPQYIG